MILLTYLFFASSFLTYIDLKPLAAPTLPHIVGAPPISVDEVHNFLTNYGYLLEKRPANATHNHTTSTNNSIVDVSNDLPYQPIEIETALKEFQQFMGLQETGKLNVETINTMKKPRCGGKDRIPRDTASLTSSSLVRFTTKGRIKNRTVALYFSKNVFNKARIFRWAFDDQHKPNKINYNQAKLAFQYACNRWSAVSDVLFEWVSYKGLADIVVSFYKGDHGDGKNFDGPGGSLAHASKTSLEAHFDDDESFQINLKHSQLFVRPNSMPDFVATAVHEVGHLLGFSHSTEKESIMYPTISGSFTAGAYYKLHSSDIANARSTYGVCWASKFNSVYSNTNDGKTYISVNYFSYQFNDMRQEVEPSWPRLTYQVFPVFDKVDEWFMHNGRMYLFKGDRYVFDWYGAFSPQIKISDKFHPQLTYVDAAFTHVDGKMYFIQKDLVYRWDSKGTTGTPLRFPLGAMEAGWPKPLKQVFPGAPESPDTVFRWYADNRVYFFKGRVFYIWDTQANKMMSGYYDTNQWKNVCNSYICSAPGNCFHWDN